MSFKEKLTRFRKKRAIKHDIRILEKRAMNIAYFMSIHGVYPGWMEDYDNFRRYAVRVGRLKAELNEMCRDDVELKAVRDE